MAADQQLYSCGADAELALCFNDARDDPDVGAIILTGIMLCPYSFLVLQNLCMELHMRHMLGPKRVKMGTACVQSI